MSTGELKHLTAELHDGGASQECNFSATVQMSNIPLGYDEVMLRTLHAQSAISERSIVSVKFLPSQDGDTIGCMLQYESMHAAKTAVKALHGTLAAMPSGAQRRLDVSLAKPFIQASNDHKGRRSKSRS